MTPFQKAVLQIVQLIPPGRVMSYGQIAVYLGMPRAARQVGWAMRSIDLANDFPWWRVLNNAGVISIKGNMRASAEEQRELLLAEGVAVTDAFTLDMATYRYRPGLNELAHLHLDPAYIEKVLSKYGFD